jgi:hypothetical protein
MRSANCHLCQRRINGNLVCLKIVGEKHFQLGYTGVWQDLMSKTQALYAHMNNKKIKIKKKRDLMS